MGSSADSTAPDSPSREPKGHQLFPQTDWSAVFAASGQGSDAEKARRTFEGLCADYRNAIVQWMRRQQLSPEDAEDAAHDFLHRWLSKENPLQGFEQGERRFRDFLSVCLRHFLLDWHASRTTQRRGGNVNHVNLESQDVLGPPSKSSSDIDQAIARHIHASVIVELRVRWSELMAEERFEQLQEVALGLRKNPGYEALAQRYGVAVGTIKSWIFRVRREYHDAFREKVGRQSTPYDLDDEVVYLHSLLLHPSDP